MPKTSALTRSLTHLHHGQDVYRNPEHPDERELRQLPAPPSNSRMRDRTTEETLDLAVWQEQISLRYPVAVVAAPLTVVATLGV